MSFFDSESCLPVRTAVEEEENYDLTFYDCGPGESSESTYETSTDYLGNHISNVHILKSVLLSC